MVACKVYNDGTTKEGAVMCFNYTVVAADVTAGYAALDFSEIGADLVGAVVQVRQSDGTQEATDVVVTLNNSGSTTASGYLKVADGAAATNLAAGDIIFGQVWTA
jgi:hypothetical protein